MFAKQIDPDAFFNKVYSTKRGLDSAVLEICDEMRIQTQLLMPK